MTVMLSPSVLTRELDYSSYVAQTSTSVVGMIGGASKGPINEAVFVTSPEDFIRKFGEPFPEAISTFSALQFLQEGDKLWYVRVADGDEDSSNLLIQDAVTQAEATLVADSTASLLVSAVAGGDYDGADGNTYSVAFEDTASGGLSVSLVGTVITFDFGGETTATSAQLAALTLTGFNFEVVEAGEFTVAADLALTDNLAGGTDAEALLDIMAVTPGTWGTEIEVEIKDVVGSEFTLVVYYKDLEVEKWDVSLDDSHEDYIEEALLDSDYIRATDSQMGAGVTIDEISRTALSGGNNGASGITGADIVGTSGTGLDIFNNTEVLDINILTAPVFSAEGAVANEMLAVCASRGDSIAIIDPPFGVSPQEVVQWHNGELGGENDPEQALNSSYGATYYPWLQIFDPYTKRRRWVPPSGFVAGQFAYNDRTSYPWFAPAGLKRGRLIRPLALEYNTSKGERDLMYSGGNAINPIVNFRQDGITIWGQRTLQRQSSATDRINVRRLMLMIRKAIASSSRYIIFDPNDEYTWNEWRGLVEPYLDSIKRARGFYDFRVQMNSETVTPQDIDQNRMPGKVLVKPTKSAEFLPIDFILYATGAEFPEASE